MDSRSDAEPDLLGPLPDYLRQATGDIASVAAPSGAGLWVVCDYAAGRQVLADGRFSRSEIIKPDSPKVNGPEPAQHSIMSMDGDDHARLRRLVAGSFTARRVAEMAPLVGQLVDGYFDQMAASGSPADIVSRVIQPLPLAVLCAVLGIPASSSESFKDGVEVLFDITDADVGKTRRRLELVSRMKQLILDKRKELADDLLSSLIQAQGKGDLSHGELLTMGLTLLMAGYETTVGQIGLMVLSLLADPGAYASLVANPELVPGAVEEALRLNPATPVSFARVAMEAVQIGDVMVEAGEAVVVSMLHGNRDESVFPGADKLILDGRASAHLTFGYGTHRCLGAPLARLQMQIILEQLIKHFPALRLADCPEPVKWKDGLATRGLLQLMVDW
jgi:cytochrome P450